MTKEIELKGFTEEEIKEMNSKAIGYRITNLKYYPTDGRFLQARLEINTGMIVVWNVDSYVLKYDKNKSGILTGKNKWIVLASDNKMFKYNEEFDNVEDAVQYAYLVYDKYINAEYEREQEKVNKVLDKRGYRYN